MWLGIYCYNPLYHKGELKGKVLNAGLSREICTELQYAKGRRASLLWEPDLHKRPDLSPFLRTQKVYWPVVSLRLGYSFQLRDTSLRL